MKDGRIDSIDMAKYILSYNSSQEKPIEINMTKLQKLLYIIDGTLLVFGLNIIGENPKAWPYGPVYPRVYKWYDGRQSFQFRKEDLPEDDLKYIQNTPKIDEVIREVFKTFGGWTACQLSEWSHMDNSPWSVAWNNIGAWSTILKDDMRAFFRTVVDPEELKNVQSV